MLEAVTNRAVSNGQVPVSPDRGNIESRDYLAAIVLAIILITIATIFAAVSVEVFGTQD
ncbi:MAG: hypothetical protein M3179_13305 [Actinomycetota bacterium]|nr:hypothetical protein [Actinomycetota bacterium]